MKVGIGLMAVLVLVASAMAAETKPAPARSATTVIGASLKAFDKAKPKELTVELENKSGKDIKHLRGALTFTDKAGKVLFTTGVTEDLQKWAADSKSTRTPFMFFPVPAELIKALETDSASVKIAFTASLLKYTDGTEEKF